MKEKVTYPYYHQFICADCFYFMKLGTRLSEAIDAVASGGKGEISLVCENEDCDRKVSLSVQDLKITVL